MPQESDKLSAEEPLPVGCAVRALIRAQRACQIGREGHYFVSLYVSLRLHVSLSAILDQSTRSDVVTLLQCLLENC